MQLTIGVTGHRDLVAEEIPALKDKVRGFFLQLRKDFPDLELQLITPLAEGSDRLVADVALELSISLIVPMPMSQAEYEQDFSSPAAVQSFRDTLNTARVIHLSKLPEPADEEGAPTGREQQYAQVGVFISNHCQILLALWDGTTTTAVGGTAGVVTYHLTGVMPGITFGDEAPNLLAYNENDLAYHIVCSRDRPGGQPKEGLQAVQCNWVTARYGQESSEHMPSDYRQMLHRIQDYGRDANRYQASIDTEGSNIFPDHAGLELPAGIEAIGQQFRVADWLAIHFQKRVARGLIVTHVLAVLIGLFFILYSEFSVLDYLVNFFLMAFLVGFVVYKVGERREWHRKYLDYRALAEGLRVQVYWNLAGVIDAHSAEFAYDNFLQKQDVDLGWIRHVMRSASLLRSREEVLTIAWIDWVVEQWVGPDDGQIGQLSYYQSKGLEKTGRFKLTQRLGKVSLWAGISIAIWLALRGQNIGEVQRHVLLVLMGVLPLIAGIRDAYSHKKAEKELIKQYRFMHGIFAHARRLLDQSDDIEFRRRVLRALGDAALGEHAEWILMHRERPLEHSSL